MTQSVSVLPPVGPYTQKAFKVIENWPTDLFIGLRYHNGQFFFVSIIRTGEGKSIAGITRELRLLEGKLINGDVDKQDRLHCPAGFINAAIVACSIPPGRLQFADAKSREEYTLKVSQYHLYAKGCREQAEFKQHGILTDRAIELPASLQYEPGNHQRAAAGISLLHGGYAYFMPMGTGKTFTAIMSAEGKARQHGFSGKAPYRVLILSPKAVCLNWQTELQKFSTLNFHAQILRGTRMKRATEFFQFVGLPATHIDSVIGVDIAYLIVSWDTLTQDSKIISGLQWDLVIGDETHLIKSVSTQRTKASLRLVESANNRLGLTGTPIANNAIDLYSQLEFIEPLSTCCKNVTQFRNTFGTVVDISQDPTKQLNKVVGVQNSDLIREMLALLSFQIPKTDAIKNLPPKLNDVAEVEMSPKQKECYNQALAGIAAKIEENLDKNTGLSDTMVLQNVLKQMLRLSQITSGFFVTDDIYDDDGNLIAESQTHRFDPNPKIEWLIETLKAKPPTSKTIIWSCWVQDIKTIKSRLSLEGIGHASLYGEDSIESRKQAEILFNTTNECKVLVGNPTVGGTGLNLQGMSDPYTNCDHLIYYCCNWSSTSREQSEDRPHRMGTRVPIQITDLVIPNTVDVEIRERVTKKRDLAFSLSDVRDIMRRLAYG